MFLFDLVAGSFVVLNMFDPTVPALVIEKCPALGSTMMCFSGSGGKAIMKQAIFGLSSGPRN